MKLRLFWGFLVVSALATVASAQTKMSGTNECGKPEAQHMLEVGDHPGHALAIGQAKCAWTKPWEIEGIQSKAGVSTASDDIHGSRSRTRGYYVDTMANGDKAFFRYEGPMTLKEGAAQSAEIKWTLTGGTGKLKGVKGQGTCAGKGGAEGAFTWECEGEYELAK